MTPIAAEIRTSNTGDQMAKSGPNEPETRPLMALCRISEWCNGCVTTTEAYDDDIWDGLEPPTRDELLDALHSLRRREGVTSAKVAKAGGALMRLPMSLDEWRRTRANGVDLSRATVAALACVVNSYDEEFPKRNRSGEATMRKDARWIILRHELNLDQAIGFDLGQRQDVAKALLDVGKDVYKYRAEGVYGVFVDEITALRRSRCRPGDEWAVEAFERFDDMPRAERQAEFVRHMLFIGEIAHRNLATTWQVLSQAMPNLASALDRYKLFARAPEPGAIIFTSLRALGEAFYDDFARKYLTDVDPKALLLPWHVLSRLMLTKDAAVQDDYDDVAREADVAILRVEWPLPVYYRDRIVRSSGGPLFDHGINEPTDRFYQALRASLELFAQLVIGMDGEGGWSVPRSALKRGVEAVTQLEWSWKGTSTFDVRGLTIEPIESIDRPQTSDAPLPAESETSQPPELEW
ncbi:hypothetical protein PP564_12945 [Mycobacteroides abscessus]|uniref:hypothetical protein n=1 Tax=Mycobacteroides abscessus TaxID=36809 RepID=UPI000C258A39|nr:hypothetical protein [Mycobacteroides abscessus]MDM2496009.1 hypothetical protein [Mycobacteroides abscessus]MDM2514632.1 hypothetical protein [Mycobacteroides abscessus]MDM2523580.1 hypothetical protein [Mycobacteroides abscessus]MDM2529793.1 hypothetical protein [Mycobacteroides abscessus]MDM2536611.1 hypothetical protein [Mycobacteroides abscessus]